MMRRFSSSNRWAAWILSLLSDAIGYNSGVVTTPLGVEKVVQGVYSAIDPAYGLMSILVARLNVARNRSEQRSGLCEIGNDQGSDVGRAKQCSGM